MMNRRGLLMALAGAACARESLAQTANDARALVEQIYKVSAGPNGKYDGPSVLHDGKLRARYLTKSLVAALDAMDRKSKRANEPILDFDPITDSQDPSVTKLTFATESSTPTRAVVAAKFFAEGAKDATIVRYVLLMEGDAWKVDDMNGGRTREGAWNLRQVIK